jgi:hypothetical protein
METPLPKRAVCLNDSVDPIVTKFRTLAADPIRVNERILIALPAFIQVITLSLLASFTVERIEILLPHETNSMTLVVPAMRMKLRIDKELPSDTASKTEKSPLHSIDERIDTLLPNEIESITLKSSDTLAHPITDRHEPIFVLALNDRHEPKIAKLRILICRPKFTFPATLIPLPSLAQLLKLKHEPVWT